MWEIGALLQEVIYFNNHEELWLPHHKFNSGVLIKYVDGERPDVSFHDSVLDAYDWGVEKYGSDPFLATSLPHPHTVFFDLLHPAVERRNHSEAGWPQRPFTRLTSFRGNAMVSYRDVMRWPAYT